MTPSLPSVAPPTASVALLLALVAAPGCRESPADPSVDDGTVVVADGRAWGDDPYVANSATIDGDRLTIEVSFAGGCQDHAFTLVLAESFRESDPVQLAATLAHEANGDLCEAWLTESRIFDLSLVKTRYAQSYGAGAGRVVLQIAGVPGESLLYEFGG